MFNDLKVKLNTGNTPMLDLSFKQALNSLPDVRTDLS